SETLPEGILIREKGLGQCDVHDCDRCATIHVSAFDDPAAAQSDARRIEVSAVDRVEQGSWPKRIVVDDAFWHHCLLETKGRKRKTGGRGRGYDSRYRAQAIDDRPVCGDCRAAAGIFAIRPRP